MARLHQKRDGDWYIRVFAGEDSQSGQQYFGTWQVHAAGLDLLRRRLIVRDDDYVPPPVFFELLRDKLIWKGGTRNPVLAREPRRPRVRTRPEKPPRKAVPSHAGLNVYAPLPLRPPGNLALDLPRLPSARKGWGGVPLVPFLVTGQQSWELLLRLDYRRFTTYDTSWLTGRNRQDLKLHVGDALRPVDISGPDGNQKLRQVRLQIEPFHTPLEVVVSHRAKRFHAGVVAPLFRRGTIFDSNGYRVRSVEPLELHEWYCSLIEQSHAPSSRARPPAASCTIRTLPDRHGWRVIAFQMHRRTNAVKEYLRQIGCELR